MGVIEQVSRFDDELRASRNERHRVSYRARSPTPSGACSGTAWPTPNSTRSSPRPASEP